MIKLNEFRKVDSEGASLVARQLFDNCCLEAGIESDGKTMVKRINTLLNKYLDKQNQPKIEWFFIYSFIENIKITKQGNYISWLIIQLCPSSSYSSPSSSSSNPPSFAYQQGDFSARPLISTPSIISSSLINPYVFIDLPFILMS